MGWTDSCTTMESIILTIRAICWEGASIGVDICAIGDIMKGSARISLKTVLKNVMMGLNQYVVPECMALCVQYVRNITEGQTSIGSSSYQARGSLPTEVPYYYYPLLRSLYDLPPTLQVPHRCSQS